MKKLDGKDLLIYELKQDIKLLENEKNQLMLERDFLKFSLEEIRKSFSYKLGLTVTSIPRKIRGYINKHREVK